VSRFLHRLGRIAFHQPFLFIGGWVGLIAVIVAILVINPPALSTELRIDGTPAQQVIDDLTRQMPQASGGQGMIAFAVPDGQRIDEGPRRAALLAAVNAVFAADHVVDTRAAMAAEMARGPASALISASQAIGRAQAQAGPGPGAPQPLRVDGAAVPGVVISPDGAVALFQFQFDRQTFELPTGTVEHTVEAARTALSGTDIRVLPSASMLQVPELIGVGEVVGVLVAALVLVVTLGSVLAAGLPLVTALTGVGVGVGGAFALSHLVNIHSLTAVLALMLGLAVGIDYALFIVNRQRRLILDLGLSASAAASRAIGTAGSAVVFAGSTVVIALLALTLVRVQVLTTMSITAAATVAIAVLCAVTLLPALLGLVGERICSPKARTRLTTLRDRSQPHPIAATWVRLLIRHRLVAVSVAVLAAGLLAVPALSMTSGLPSGASYNTATAQRDSYDLVAEHLGEGYNGALIVVAQPASHDAALTDAALVDLVANLQRISGVESVDLVGLDDTRTTAVLSVIPASGPNDPATTVLVKEIRSHSGQLARAAQASVGVTGFTALAIDVSDRLTHILPTYLGVVLALTLIILLVVFRSVIVPLKATLGFLLSIAATFGATTAVFQWGWLQQLLGIDATAPVLSLLPIIVTGVLYGLAMDYEVFLVSSIKEAHVHGHHGDHAIEHGFTQASRVVCAAAIIMISVFAGFAFNPDPMIKQVGFALAFGILIDAFVVRMTLVPAVMSLFGDRAWWLPRQLDRHLPNLDIEGDTLAATLHATDHDRPPSPLSRP
jgi:RND superfamily putative drug exporter